MWTLIRVAEAVDGHAGCVRCAALHCVLVVHMTRLACSPYAWCPLVPFLLRSPPANFIARGPN